jgi:hypothetical protein
VRPPCKQCGAPTKRARGDTCGLPCELAWRRCRIEALEDRVRALEAALRDVLAIADDAPIDSTAETYFAIRARVGVELPDVLS